MVDTHTNWIVSSLDQTSHLIVTEMTPDEKDFITAANGKTLDEALLSLSEEQLSLLSEKIGAWTGKWIQYNLIAVVSNGDKMIHINGRKLIHLEIILSQLGEVNYVDIGANRGNKSFTQARQKYPADCQRDRTF